MGENVSGAMGGHWDSKSRDRKNRSEPVDGGYGESGCEGSDNNQGGVTEADEVSSVFDDSDFRQFYEPEYGRM